MNRKKLHCNTFFYLTENSSAKLKYTCRQIMITQTSYTYKYCETLNTPDTVFHIPTVFIEYKVLMWMYVFHGMMLPSMSSTFEVVIMGFSHSSACLSSERTGTMDRFVLTYL